MKLHHKNNGWPIFPKPAFPKRALSHSSTALLLVGLAVGLSACTRSKTTEITTISPYETYHDTPESYPETMGGGSEAAAVSEQAYGANPPPAYNSDYAPAVPGAANTAGLPNTAAAYAIPSTGNAGQDFGSAPSSPAQTASPSSDFPVVIGDPYTVDGQLYTPSTSMNYDEVGYATIDPSGMQHGITLAHKTLPLPSYVEITALDTGQTVLARVERRGPMTSSRIAELSGDAGTLLNIRDGGAIRVRRVNPPESERVLLRHGSPASERIPTPDSLVQVLRRKLPNNGTASLYSPQQAAMVQRAAQEGAQGGSQGMGQGGAQSGMNGAQLRGAATEQAYQSAPQQAYQAPMPQQNYQPAAQAPVSQAPMGQAPMSQPNVGQSTGTHHAPGTPHAASYIPPAPAQAPMQQDPMQQAPQQAPAAQTGYRPSYNPLPQMTQGQPAQGQPVQGQYPAPDQRSTSAYSQASAYSQGRRAPSPPPQSVRQTVPTTYQAPVQQAPQQYDGGEQLVVQAGAFASKSDAERVARAIGGYVEVLGAVYRVRMGPYTSRGQAEAELAKVHRAGYSEARIFIAR